MTLTMRNNGLRLIRNGLRLFCACGFPPCPIGLAPRPGPSSDQGVASRPENGSHVARRPLVPTTAVCARKIYTSPASHARMGSLDVSSPQRSRDKHRLSPLIMHRSSPTAPVSSQERHESAPRPSLRQSTAGCAAPARRRCVPWTPWTSCACPSTARRGFACPAWLRTRRR